MTRLLRLSLLVLLITVPAFAHSVAPAAGAKDPAAAVHPLVGAWKLDVDVQAADDPPIYLLVHADGTLLVATPYFGDGVGLWQPKGERTADATVVFQDLNSDPTQVAPGTLTA